MEISAGTVAFPFTLSALNNNFISVLLSIPVNFPFFLFFSSPCYPPLPSFGNSNISLKSPTAEGASLNQAALLNVPEPVLIQPEESFHLPLYTRKLSILRLEINSHLSPILK